MPICTRRGCGVVFDPSVPSSEPCAHHPGAPKFHEGSKSWTCCESVNKPVLDFDDFMAIKGCTVAQGHTLEKQDLPAGSAVPASTAGASSKDASGKETYGSAPATITPLTGPSLSAAQGAAAAAAAASSSSSSPSGAAASAAKKPEAIEEADPTDAQIPEDAPCKRKGCKGVWSAEEAKKGARERGNEVCRYHKGVAIFHEGSKGWSCCKPRVLDFDDFLSIPPCTTSSHGHLFLGAPPSTEEDASAEEPTTCRLDHYETPTDVRLTVYAKGVDMARSSVRFDPEEVHFSLALPAAAPGGRTRRFERTLRPFAQIDQSACTFVAGKFKLDVVLVKGHKGVSWPTLERGEQVIGYGLTFGRQ